MFVDPAVPHAFGNEESSLIEVARFEAQRQRSILLVVLGLNIDVFVEQVHDRKEVVFLARVVQDGPLVDVQKVEVYVFVVYQHLQYLHLL